ncbi:MAG: radical SAM protein [Ignavibacteriaceae bacterium]|nr:radical SAM protein [Ignavibacteriaceae bacterium]
MDKLTADESNLLKNYLSNRLKQRSIKRGLSIVYDITYFCNLCCKGCAVNAKKHKSTHISVDNLELTTEKVFTLLDKIKNHIDKNNIKSFFLNYGGGEPFLRSDFKEILKYSSKLFGKESVATDTNGTFVSVNDLLEIKDYVSYVGVSIDGLEYYHNNWRGRTDIDNPFQKSMNLITESLKYPELKNILEVSSVATKENISEIPILIKELNNLGVKAYSVHRTFPVGRMAKFTSIIPDTADYINLALIIAKANEDYEIDCHFHHSIESIYGTILLGWDTYIADQVVGNPDSRSSFGIDPTGNIYFDPWCMVKPWNQLIGGNILSKNFNFDYLTSGKGIGMLEIAKQYSLMQNRCDKCHLRCSGGSRIAASAFYLADLKRESLSDLLIGLSKIDPICPLYSKKN